MRKYDSYKDSGIEWIGEIPSHWETKRIRHIADIFGRIGYRGYTVEDIVFDESGAISLSPSNIENQKLTLESVTRITQEKYEESPEIMVFENDVVLVKTASVGKAAIVRPLNDLATINPQLVVFKNYRIDQTFFYYEIISRIIQDQITQDLNGGVVNTITQTNLNNYSIIVPQPQEQTAIAAYLDRKTAEIDELIADKKRLLELYEEEKTAIINQAVTKGINPDVPMKDSGIEWLGEIPEHWETSPLKYLGKFINGFSFKSTDFVSTGVRVLKISNIQHMRIDWSDESFIDETFYETHENFRVLENDLVFALTRPIISTGIKVALIDTTEPILLNQRNSIYRPTDINVKWIYYILLSSNFIQEFDSRIDKTGQQPNISSNDIGEIKITIPNEDEQNAIISFIDERCSEIDAKKAKTEKLIELLTEYRTALISEVVTGKIKVTD